MSAYDMIIAAEEQFAREVALGVFVTKPQTIWHYVIPGFFMIDFLRRGSAVRRYSKKYMFPRRLAIDAANAGLQGQTQDSMHGEIEEAVVSWMSSSGLQLEELRRAQLRMVELLSAHYAKLLSHEADSYPLLINKGYQNKDAFEAHLAELSLAEKEVDRALLEGFTANPKLQEQILAERQQVQMRREKIKNQAF